MKKDIYKNAMIKTTASDKAKADAKALFDAVNSEVPNKVITITNKKQKRKLPFVAILAASLAIVFALSTVVGLNGIPLTENGNSFILTVGAEEINKTPLVVPNDVIGTAFSDQSYAAVFPITCKGENIDSITYSIENAVFIYDSNDFIDSTLYGKKINCPGTNNEDDENHIPDNVYSSFTVKYNNPDDLQEFYDHCPNIAGSTDLLKDNSKIVEELTKEMFDDKTSYKDFFKLEKQVLDLYFKDVVVTITANFTDGTTQTQKIKLGCEIGNYYEENSNLEYPEGKDTSALFITYTLV